MDMQAIPVVKMNGIGNEIVVADLRGGRPGLRSDLVAEIGANGLHFDQLMAVGDPAGPGRDHDVEIFNNDGSRSGACGNGTRCVAAWLNRHDGKAQYRLQTAAGLLKAWYQDNGAIAVDMGTPRFGWQEIPLAEEFGDTTGIELQIGPIDAPVLHTPSVVNMGNPHAVFWVNGDTGDYDLGRFGPLLENHPIFPERANITVARVVDPGHIEIRTWERGVGLTRACGSAACASVVAGVRKQLCERQVEVTLPGGRLDIVWQEDNHVIMAGPVEFEYGGHIDAASGRFHRESAGAEV